MAASARETPRVGGDQTSQVGVDWCAAELFGDAADGSSVVSRRLIFVAVGSFDLRAVTAVEQAWRIPALERRALHIVDDDEAANCLARAWMESEFSFPLQFAEDEGGVGSTIARLVRMELMGGFDDVIVLVGRLVFRRRIHRLLHDRTADGISRALSMIPAVHVSILNVAFT